MAFVHKGLSFYWLGHDGFRIENHVTIYFDPYQLEGPQKRGDIVFVTHDHFDHLSIDDLKKVVSEETTIVTVQHCVDELRKLKSKEVAVVDPGQEAEVLGVRIKAIPAYNVNKFRAPGQPFHPKEYGGAGYLVEIDGVTIYHAGDTDVIPDMEGLEPEVALLPVSGTYVMTPQEAAEAAEKIRPKVAIPMHFASIVGSWKEAEEFEKLADVRVEIPPKS
ncbi:MAG: MBL fold metallo-hydrolase [Candidatus Geothermarchaeales archaeon]